MKVKTRTKMTRSIAVMELMVFSSGTWWMQTWWSTDTLTTLASLNPLHGADSSLVGRNSRPVMKVEWALRTLFTRDKLNAV